MDEVNNQLLEEANLAFDQGDFDKALLCYNDLNSRNPELLAHNILVNQNLAMIHRYLGNLSKAETYRFKALEIEETISGKVSLTRRWKSLANANTCCDLCGGTNFDPMLTRPDGIKIVCCRQCGLHFVNPMIDPGLLKKIYTREYFTGGNVYGYKDDYFSNNKTLLWEQRLNAIEAYGFLQPDKKSILEIGCANGNFLDVCRTRGWQVQGVDLSEAACAEARKSGIDVFCGQLKDAGLAPGSFDFVVMWDLIEHLISPMSQLTEIAKLLKDNGILSITTPNLLKAYLSKEDWIGFNCSYEHVYYFEPATLIRYLERVKLDVEVCFSYDRDNFAMDRIGHVLFLIARKKPARNQTKENN